MWPKLWTGLFAAYMLRDAALFLDQGLLHEWRPYPRKARFSPSDGSGGDKLRFRRWSDSIVRDSTRLLFLHQPTPFGS